jgi:DNA-binding winged helix-turn-helix (wHTH) protein/Tol biopolymer transport system component
LTSFETGFTIGAIVVPLESLGYFKMKVTAARTASFGPYALDLRSGELRKFGVRVKMGEQPFQILLMLLESAGEMVSRDELRAKLWVDDTFVDFDHGLNSAVQRLRDCLSDTAEKPLWIETIPRRGYRFIGRAEWLSDSPTPFPRDDERTAGAARTNEFPREDSGQQADIHERTSGSRWVYLALGGLILVFILVAGIRTLLNHQAVAPFAHFSATKLTNSGHVNEPAISPDGRYVLSVVHDKGRMSLWLLNVGTGSNTQISPPEALSIKDPAFSPDGDFVYFRRANNATEEFWDLYRVPLLGGAAQNVIHDVDGGPAFSPGDPRRVIFIRLNDPEVGKYYLLSADLDGGNEKVLVDEKELPAKTLSWSPDAKLLADVIFAKDGGSMMLRTFDLAAKKWRTLAEFKDRDIRAVDWAPDGRGVYVCFRLHTAPPNVAQIGFVSFPRGEFHEVTNDLNGYLGVHISKDGKFISTLQAQLSVSILLQASDAAKASARVPLPAQEWIVGFDWASDSEILVAGTHAVRRLNLDGSGETTLTSDPNAQVIDVVNCGHYILVPWWFKNNTNQLNIWRVDPDGENLMQLTHGRGDLWPQCSSEGNFVYYYESVDAMWTMRIPIGGGTPEKLRLDQSDRSLLGQYGFGISRNGRWMATSSHRAAGPSRVRIHVLGLGENAAAPAPFFIGDPRFMKSVRITPDGRFVTYVIDDQGSKMLWAQPVDGGAGHPLTEGSRDDLVDYRWSPDAKTLAVERIHWQVDVVLLKDTSR